MTHPTEVKLPESLEAIRAALPMLPASLLNTIGEYGMARTDRVSELTVQYRWKLLLAGIKDYTAAQVKARDAEIERLTKERDDARRAKTGHFSPVYLLANARRIAAPEYAMMPNWALATQIFAVGSTTANTICRENGIDPNSKTGHDAAAIDQARAEGGEKTK